MILTQNEGVCGNKSHRFQGKDGGFQDIITTRHRHDLRRLHLVSPGQLVLF